MHSRRPTSDAIGCRALLQGPTFDSSLEGNAVAIVDAVASRSTDGKRIFIKAVNTDPTNPIFITVSLKGVTIARPGTSRDREWQ